MKRMSGMGKKVEINPGHEDVHIPTGQNIGTKTWADRAC